MTLSRRSRRRVDALVALGIAVAVAVVGVGIYLGGDSRAVTLTVAPADTAPATPAAPTAVPRTLHQVWSARTDPDYGAVASPYGTVVTADEHTVTGRDAATGTSVWSYTRANRSLCAIGSGDFRTDPVDQWTGVHGIMTVYAKNGYCSQVTLLDPSTGERLYQRTSPNEDPGRLIFGEPYVGWVGSDYLELWRHDLVATIRYGNQPNPVNSSGPHRGCLFTDAAVTRMALATVEHCGGRSADATVVLNWPTPSDAPDLGDKGWDANHSEPKATIKTGSTNAVIAAITDDRIAVVVSDPSPALVVYSSAGKQISRTPVDVTAAEITATAAAGITPSVTDGVHRYTLIGHHLLATSATDVTVTVTPTAPPTGTPASSTAPSGDADAPTTTTESNPVLDWIAPDADGLPAMVADSVLVPTEAGYAVRAASDGNVADTIRVDRGTYRGRVDASAVGSMIIESRGSQVVGLR